MVSYGADKLADGGSIVLTSGALSRRPGKGSTALAIANASLEAAVKVVSPQNAFLHATVFDLQFLTSSSCLCPSCRPATSHSLQGLAHDLGPRLRANCVSPGLTNTEMWAGMPEEKRRGMLEGFGSTLPLKRAGESSDVGDAIAFLLTASYSTGITLDVDGGAVIR